MNEQGVASGSETPTLRAERDSLMADSWRAFVEAGADPDGNLRWHCSPEIAGRALVDAVTSLREDYEAALAELDSYEDAARLARSIAQHNAERHTGFVHIGRILARVLPDTSPEDSPSPEGTT